VVTLASIPPDGEGFQPRFRSRQPRVENVFENVKVRYFVSRKIRSTAFRVLSCSIAFRSKPEGKSVERVPEVVCIIDEKRDVRDVLFLATFAKESSVSCVARV